MSATQLILDVFYPMLRLPYSEVHRIGNEMPIPRFQAETVHMLISEALGVFETGNVLVRYNRPVVIVGDIHGNLQDLVRIFVMNGIPPTTNYLFLGDYVDRGSYSIEVLCLLFAFARKYHNNFFLLRGNHEIKEVNQHYGFKESVMKEYDDELMYDSFNRAFEYLPLAAVLHEKFFCVHGGLSPLLEAPADLEKLTFPITEITPMINDVLWSDPTNSKCTFLENQRGNGFIFGVPATFKFLKDSKMRAIIRGHQCVQDGVEMEHSEHVITVFSSSLYEQPGNFAGFLTIEEGQLAIGRMKPIRHIQKDIAKIQNVSEIAKPEVYHSVQSFMLKSAAELSKSIQRMRTSASRATLIHVTCRRKSSVDKHAHPTGLRFRSNPGSLSVPPTISKSTSLGLPSLNQE